MAITSSEQNASEPKFLFIFTHPYSGSTALAKLLNTSPRSMVLHPKAEGQWLIQEMSGKNRWNSQTEMPWPRIKAVWMEKYRSVNDLVGGISVVIDKSPPNMLRTDQVIQHFPGCSYFAFYRNPYANCSSILYRNYPVETYTEDERHASLRKIALAWVRRGRHLRDAIEAFDMLHFSYEYFCANVEAAAQKVLSICPELGAIDPDAEVVVKDYPPQKIMDMNEAQISRLSPSDLQAITSELREHSDLLKLFGYDLIE
jgi:hypothetical protein